MKNLEAAELLAVMLRGAAEGLEVYLKVETPEADEPETSGATTCQHPEESRQPEPVSGQPRAFLCTVCLQVVNPDEVTDASPE